MNSPQNERRRHRRFDLEYDIQIIGDDGKIDITAMTNNISNGGLRIPVPKDCLPECGAEVQVNLTVRRTDTGQADLRTGTGEVVRHTAEGEDGLAELALKFDDPLDLQLDEEA